MLLDGEDVVKLLKLSTMARNDIEEAARQHGPVVRGNLCFYQAVSSVVIPSACSPKQNGR